MPQKGSIRFIKILLLSKDLLKASKEALDHLPPEQHKNLKKAIDLFEASLKKGK